MRSRGGVIMAVCALWLAACGSRAAPVAPQTRPLPRIQLVPASADVFAYQIEVRLVTDNAAEIERCHLLGAREPLALQPNTPQRIGLIPGVNDVSAECSSADGRTLRAASARYHVRLDGAPVASARLRVHADALLLSGEALPAYPGAPAPVTYEWFALHGGPAATELLPLGTGHELLRPLPTQDGDHAFALRVHDRAGVSAETFAVLRVDRGVAREKQPGEPPVWLTGGVIYGVIPPLWGEPALAAVTTALDQLHDLGVAALWLSPVFATPPGDFGYAVTDSFRVRADYGDGAALRALVEQAHRRGLRVLLDLVPNHTSAEHPYFREARALGPRSHYFQFYDRDAEGRPTYYFDWAHLPNLNYQNPEVVSFTLESAKHWLRTAGADGYRVDAAWGIQQRAPSFWPLFTRSLQATRPALWLLAEASARDPAYLAAGFDAAYDWSAELGHHAWERVFEASAGIAQRLADAVSTESGTAPERVFRFLNNNDTGPRFITRHGEALTRVATAALLTLPGVPCVYAFDELGAAFEPYKPSGPIVAQNDALRAFHRLLIRLRRAEPALHGGKLSLLHVGSKDEGLVYLRHSRADERWALVALNFSARPLQLSVTLPQPLDRRWSDLRDALSGAPLRHTRAQAQLTLPAWGTQVFVAER